MDDKTSTAATKARPEYVPPGPTVQRTIFMAMFIGWVVHWIRSWWVEGLEHCTQVPQVNCVALQVDQQKTRGARGRDKRVAREGREAS